MKIHALTVAQLAIFAMLSSVAMQAKSHTADPLVPQIKVVKQEAQWLEETAMRQLHKEWPSLTAHDLELLKSYRIVRLLREQRHESLTAHTE